MLSAGDQAPGFELKDIEGADQTLEQLKAHKPALVAFFKASCPVCQLTLPFLERMSAGGIEMAAVSQDDRQTTEQFRSRFGVRFRTLLDESKKGYPASNAYGIVSVPSLFLVEPDGRISLAVAGFSKKDMELIGERAGVAPFRGDEPVPVWKAG